MESYIVRIYRRDEQDPDGLAGVVEDAENGRQVPFRNLGELAAIFLNRRPVKTEAPKSEPA